jgi:hypothetical protein
LAPAPNRRILMPGSTRTCATGGMRSIPAGVGRGGPSPHRAAPRADSVQKQMTSLHRLRGMQRNSVTRIGRISGSSRSDHPPK